MQEPGESYDHFRTALLKLAEGCNFETITPDEILRDRLVFGIKDQQAREKLLRKANLTLADTDDICRSHEATSTQMKMVEETLGTINLVDPSKDRTANKELPSTAQYRECRNCGRKHDFSKREFVFCLWKAVQQMQNAQSFCNKVSVQKSSAGQGSWRGGRRRSLSSSYSRMRCG